MDKKDDKKSCKKGKKKTAIKIGSLDIDKNEYQEIVLSNSNTPDRDFFRKN